MAEAGQRSRLFGTDGVRGVAGDELTASLAVNLSVAAAAVLGRAEAGHGDAGHGAPSQLPTPPLPSEAYQSAPVRYLVNEARQGILPDEALEEIKRNPTGLRAMMAYGEGALGVGTLLAGGEGVKLPKGGRLSAGEGFAWGAKPMEEIQGLPKSGVMPEGRFAKAGSEAGQFSKDELALMKQVVPQAFTETGVDVPTLYKGLGESGPVVEVKKLGASSDPVVADQERQQVRHQLDTQLGPDWVEWHRSDRRREAITDNQRNMLDRYYELEDIVGQGPAGTTASYAFVGPKPEGQMPGYVEGLVRIPENYKIGGTQRLEGDTVASPLYRGPHFGAEDTNVLSSYRGYEETLPNGEKAFHVIEVQSDWGQKIRDNQERIDRGDYSSGNTVKGMDHPLLPHYETLGLKAAIQHAKEIGATKVILPDAETAMMTEGHDSGGNARAVPTKGATPQKVSDPHGYNFDTKLPDGWEWNHDVGAVGRLAMIPMVSYLRYTKYARTKILRASQPTISNICHPVLASSNQKRGRFPLNLKSHRKKVCACTTTRRCLRPCAN